MHAFDKRTDLFCQSQKHAGIYMYSCLRQLTHEEEKEWSIIKAHSFFNVQSKITINMTFDCTSAPSQQFPNHHYTQEEWDFWERKGSSHFQTRKQTNTKELKHFSINVKMQKTLLSSICMSFWWQWYIFLDITATCWVRQRSSLLKGTDIKVLLSSMFPSGRLLL